MKQKGKVQFSDVLVMGFAIFAMFFGAGNLIFPPYLGMMSGSQWFGGFLCFILADAGMAMLTIAAMVHGNGSVLHITGRLGRRASILLSTAGIVCVGPLICIPRTAATTFEMGILPLAPNLSPWIFSLIFFALVYLLTVRPSTVVDIIGKTLTPIILAVLAILFTIGILNPIGPISNEIQVQSVAQEGFLAGYQTMDVLAALGVTMIITTTAREKGYTEEKSRLRLILSSCIVASIGLFIVYCGLTFLGATTSSLDMGNVNQTGLMVAITDALMNRFGVVMLAVIVTCACITAGVGLVSSSARYFVQLSGQRLSYESFVAIIICIGFFISNLGISTIIKAATPILNIIYPVLLTQIVLIFFDRRIKNDNVYKGAALGALGVSILTVAGDFGAPVAFLQSLPLASIGFNWVVPAMLGGLIGNCIISRKPFSHHNLPNTTNENYIKT